MEARKLARARILCDAARLDASLDAGESAERLRAELCDLRGRLCALRAEGRLAREDENAAGVAERVLQRATSSSAAPDAAQ
jgi:hypothetical protein